MTSVLAALVVLALLPWAIAGVAAVRSLGAERRCSGCGSRNLAGDRCIACGSALRLSFGFHRVARRSPRLLAQENAA